MTEAERFLGIDAPIHAAVTKLAVELRRRAFDLGTTIDINVEHILLTRANLFGLPSPGRISANGQSRLIRCRDSWIALSLARPEDVDLVDALVGRPLDGDPWKTIEGAASNELADAFVARGRLLGLPISVVSDMPSSMGAPIKMSRRSSPKGHATIRELNVADLSSLWAGPLTAKILADLGARVGKIESSTRLDGARARPEFYSTLHDADQTSIVIDFSSPREVDELRRTLESADVVIEASRPRALRHLGLGPGQVESRAGSVWLSITGHGSQPPADDWVAFGDDGAAAGGLVAWSNHATPSFVGDAIADPLTGLMGALGVLESLVRGGGHLIEVSLMCSSAWIAANAVGPLLEECAD